MGCFEYFSRANMNIFFTCLWKIRTMSKYLKFQDSKIPKSPESYFKFGIKIFQTNCVDRFFCKRNKFRNKNKIYSSLNYPLISPNSILPNSILQANKCNINQASYCKIIIEKARFCLDSQKQFSLCIEQRKRNRGY